MTPDKHFNLIDRTLKFSKDVMSFVKLLPRDMLNRPLVDQLIRSATSIGANYREANESETKKDFKYRITICRRESKETIYWLELLKENNQSLASELDYLLQESQELVKIFASIVLKCR